jgi:hypothetical protein
MRHASRRLLFVIHTSTVFFQSVFATTGGPTEPSYQPSPPGRGTVQLLSTCIITLVLCIWTAIHMNVPGRKERGKWTRLGNKALWALLALFAPEMVVWRAFVQRQSASKLRDACNKILLLEQGEQHSAEAQQEENEGQVEVTTDVERNGGKATDTKKGRWSLSLGYFGVMGGFEVEHPKLQGDAGDDSDFTLTPQGVLLFRELNLLPSAEVLKHSVNDKNKTDSLAKGLVCFQAIWMLIQTVARKASGLPVTLLELNTLAHVVCAVVLYVLWWDKPQDVKEPEVIRIENPSLAAFISFPAVYVRQHLSLLGNGGPDENRHEDHAQPNNSSQTSSFEAQHPSSSHARTPSDRITCLHPGQHLLGTPFSNGSKTEELNLVQWDVERLHLLARLWNPPENFGRIIFPDASGSPRWTKRHKYNSERASNLEINGNLGDEEQGYVSGSWFYSFSESMPMLALLSFLYGGIHLTSWNGHFPSNVEEMMWRISGSIVVSGGIVVYVLTRISEWSWHSLRPGSQPSKRTSAAEFTRTARRFMRKVVRPEIAVWRHWSFYDVLSSPLFTISGLLLRGWSLLYVIARVFLITEAFISLRNLPLGAYSTVNWVDTLPHI